MTLRPRVYIAALWSLAALAGGVHCIVPCNEIACDGGFEWTAAPEDGTTIVPGEYRLEIVVEGAEHEIVCNIAAGLQDSECTEPVGDSDFDLSVDLTPRQASDTWDPDAPVEALRVSIADNSDWDDEDRTESVRGPEEIEITMTLADRVLVDEAFAPEYERSEEFWGDERCGFCDERVDAASAWVP